MTTHRTNQNLWREMMTGETLKELLNNRWQIEQSPSCFTVVAENTKSRKRVICFLPLEFGQPPEQIENNRQLANSIADTHNILIGIVADSPPKEKV